MSFQCDLLKVSGKDVLSTYQELKTNSGVMPVILGDNEDIASHNETMGYINDSFSDLLYQANDINPLEWFVKRQAQDQEYYNLSAGDWQDLTPATELSAHLNLHTGRPKDEIYIALVPVAKSWMIPAFLKSGGWNECPTAAEHAAIFKYWHERYGITVAAITKDVIELEVQNPPITKEEALRLAEQQFIYCPDIVYQGTETIASLAATLLNGKVWFFWWD